MSELMELPKTFAVSTLDEFTQASDLLAQWKDQLKKIDADEKAITAPINKSLKEIRAKYKPIKERCDQAISTIRAALNEYKRVEDAKQAEAKRAIEELVSEGASLSEVVSLVDEAPILGGRLTTIVTADINNLSVEYVVELLGKVWDTVMIQIRKDVAAGRVEHGVVVTKEKRL